ncbi:MAG TPA: acyltransferase [Pyrinomonadaceae bacterium]|nr:acyltransferase [Pyrinomonadaceae bacterium]
MGTKPSLRKRVMQRLQRELVKFLQPPLEAALLRQYHVYGDASLVELAETASVNNGLFNVASGKIKIEDYVFFGHNVCVITGTHDYNKFDLERQQTIPASGRDIVIKRGAWIGSNVTILGPCSVGEHSVVAAGSLVRDDVPPYSIVAGVPARKIRNISRTDLSTDSLTTEQNKQSERVRS